MTPNKLSIKMLLTVTLVLCLSFLSTGVLGKLTVYWGMPICETSRDANGNPVAILYCKGTYSMSGTCRDKFPNKLQKVGVPPSGCFNPIIRCNPATGTSPSANFQYECPPTPGTTDPNIIINVFAGPECFFSCDPAANPNPAPPSSNCRQSSFSQLTSGNSSCSSPIILDLAGDGFDLTDAAGGVSFDIMGTKSPVQIAWTMANSDDAWLALDRNGNGQIDDGSELFGNYTAQPLSDEPNGFLALMEFDQASQGGNRDGKIDQSDSVYQHLVLWQDRNHNGRSEAEELQALANSVVKAISLNYQMLRLQDRNGNAFRYRAVVTPTPGNRLGRFAYDVFLVTN
jgi:hypothetical protein